MPIDNTTKVQELMNRFELAMSCYMEASNLSKYVEVLELMDEMKLICQELYTLNAQRRQAD